MRERHQKNPKLLRNINQAKMTAETLIEKEISRAATITVLRRTLKIIIS